MNIDKVKKIVEEFPELFNNGQYFSIDCGDGWFNIIYNLCKQLTNISKWENYNINVLQIKEKYGTLRFYTDTETDIMTACIEYAESRSAYTCEECGNIGFTRGGSWLKTLCTEHAIKYNYNLKSWEKEDYKGNNNEL